MSGGTGVSGRPAAGARTLTRVGALILSLALAAPVLAQDAPPESEADVELLVLSPESGDRVAGDAVLVAVSFRDPGARLDRATLRLEVDGRDVTAEASVGTYTIRWRPAAPFRPGPHRVRLEASDLDGNSLPPLTWGFTVGAAGTPGMGEEGPGAGAFQERRSWVPTGSVIFETAALTSSGPGADFRRDESFVPRLWVNAAGTIRPGWRYATRIHVSGYESSSRQPVNRFRFDVRSRRLNLAFGDVNPNLQQLMLAGRRVRGFQGDVGLGPVRLEVATGQARRAIEGLLDPADPTRILRTGTYGQDLIALRPSVGSGDRFRFGLTFLRVRDDVGSIDGELRTDPDPISGGSASAAGTPRDNVVAGADLTLRFLEGRLLLQYENAISFYTNDISDGPLTEAALDSILQAAGFEPLGMDPTDWERFFILNGSTIPIDPREQTNVAHQVRSSFRAGSHLVSLEWRHVGGSYYTLGYPSLQRDQSGFRIRDSFSVLANALALSAGIERFEDNLDEVKPATTTSTGLFADASWQPSRDRVGLTGSVRVGSRSNGLAAGSQGAMDEGNWAVSAGVTWPLAEAPLAFLDRYRTDLLLNVSFMKRDDDENPGVGTSNLFFLGGVRGETFERDGEFSFLYGLNRSELTGFDDATTTFHRAMANLKRPFSPTLAGTLDGTLTLARSPESSEVVGIDYNRVEVMVGGEWEWQSTSLVTFGVGMVNYSDSRFEDRDTREFLTRLRVSRSF